MDHARTEEYGPRLSTDRPPEAQSSGSAKAHHPPPASSRPTAPPPSPVTSCDPGGCWDSGGRRYNGSGSVMIRGDGRVCQPVGGVMQCN